jgi:tetratricopeptide (TPR) repeat protein
MADLAVTEAADASVASTSDASAGSGDAGAPANGAPSTDVPLTATATGEWASLAAAFEREATALGPDPIAARLFHEAGHLHEVRLSHPERALELYRRGLALDAKLLVNLQSARRVARALGDAQLECELLEAEAAATASPRDVSELKLVRARVLEESAGRGPDGRAALSAAAATDPENLAVVEHQAMLAAGDRRHEELARALERCAALVQDPSLSAAWLICASAVEESRLGRHARAADLALRAFELAPQDAGVRAEARRHAEREKRFDALAAVLSVDASSEGIPPREAALTWCAVARLYDDFLSRPEDALAALDKARQAAGSNSVALDAVARIHEARGAWDAAAEALRARAAADVVGAPEEAAEVVEGNLRLAELCIERLGRTEEAAACYRAVLVIDPKHRGALSALGRIYAGASDWEKLVETCLAERAAATEARDKAQRCFKAAEVTHERLGRVDDALTLYAEALALDPSLTAAHEALERLYDSTGRHADLVALLESDLGSTPDPDESVALLFRLARLQEDRLSDLGAAAQAYERILETSPRRADALRALAGVLERAGRFSDLVKIYDQLAALASEPRRAITLLQRRAELQEEELNDEGAAAATYERILGLDPAHLPALRALGRLYASAGRWSDLVVMCRAEADVSPSTESAANVLHRVGDILERRLGQEREAIAAYREVLMLSPSHVGALRALARLYRSRSEWEPLIEVLRADAAGRTSIERQAALLSEVAEIWETRLGDLEHAVEVHEEVLRISPTFGPSARALDRLLADAGRWTELARLRREQADRLRGAARAAALVGAARILLDRLGDTAAAEAACRDALAECPGDPSALVLLARFPGARAEARTALAARTSDPRGAAQLLVGAALDVAAAGSASRSAEAMAHAAALAPRDPVAGPLAEPALWRAGDPQTFAAYCQARREGETGKTGQATWALRAAEAWEEAGDVERAVAAYRESLALEPHVAAWAGVARVQARRQEWPEVREALRAQGQALRDPTLAAAAFVQAGEIALRHLEDEAGAAEDWRAAMERDPLNGTVASGLMSLYRSAGRTADACTLQESRAQTETVPDRAAEAWMEAAKLAAAAGERERALASVDRALEAVPAVLEPLRMRARLLEDLGRHADAARDLTACLGLAREPAKLALVHLDLAAIYAEALPDPPRALSHLNAVLAVTPDHPDALARLARVHRDARNWPAAADALRRLVALPKLEPEARRNYLLELADVREQGYDDLAGARELCERALEITPDDPATLERLARLRGQAGDHSGVVSALEAAAAAAPAGPERVKAHLRAARVLSSAMGDPRRAIEQVQHALEVDPHHVEARAALADLYASTEPALAIEEHRRFLADDPARLESWRAIFAISKAQKAHDRAFVAAGVLRFLGAADPATDAAYYAENVRHAPTGTPSVIAPGEWFILRHAGDRGLLSELLSIVGHTVAEAVEWPPAPKEKQKLAQPLARLAEELSVNVGIEPFALKPGADGEVRIEPLDPPSVRVGPEVARRYSVSEQRFLLARAAARIRAHSGIAAHLDVPDLGDFMAAVVRQIVPHYESTGRPSEKLVRAIGRVLPRKIKKAAEETAKALARNGLQDVRAWRAALAATADRVGLLLSADVPAALGLLLREGGPASGPAEIAAAVRDRPDLREMMLFVASEEHMKLRQRLKLAIA